MKNFKTFVLNLWYLVIIFKDLSNKNNSKPGVFLKAETIFVK